MAAINVCDMVEKLSPAMLNRVFTHHKARQT